MERTTYNGLMGLMRSMWNYKFHNAPNNYVEPYPEELKPSEIYKRLNPKFHYVNENEVLKYADHIYLNKALKGKAPYRATFYYNNPAPFTTEVYAHNIKEAKTLAILDFSNYLKSKNNLMYRPSLINIGINNKTIDMKIKEI